MPSLHDTRTGTIAPVTPLREGIARIYVCGITPYDATHLGHAATYHAADLMRRAFRDAGLRVEVAQNVTDVDDPLFERAERDDIAWQDLAARETALFASDMEHLRVIAPETYLSVSEDIAPIIAMIQELYERGRIYQVDTPDSAGEDWYLDLAQDGALGGVSGWSTEQMLEVFAERGGDPDRTGKRGIFDPLVWRAERAGEPAWDAGILGRGRPGWHVECVCIARGGLGLPFDVQAGGRDLIFPHHDLSAAHAAALGDDFAGIYPHTGMVAYQGEKMSKSLGNLVFVSRLVEDGADPMAVRLVLMDHHYRSDWEWTDAELERAGSRLRSYRDAARRQEPDAQVVQALRAALRDDLATPRALSVLDAWADGHEPPSSDGEGAQALPADAPSDVPDAVDALFGISLRD
jgi:L-cysteine:1D-myo-inositol 2-amino-2-deoxy-alpha-D-glucopyranoside ligase